MWSWSHPFWNSWGSPLSSKHHLWRGRLEKSPIWKIMSMTRSGDRLISGYLVRDWLRGDAWYQLTDREWIWGARESKPPCVCLRSPNTAHTKGHALDVLAIRKICPFSQWISAHLCPKTVPHAFLCMWTWQSSANHQQDVFCFPNVVSHSHIHSFSL